MAVSIGLSDGLAWLNAREQTLPVVFRPRVAYVAVAAIFGIAILAAVYYYQIGVERKLDGMYMEGRYGPFLEQIRHRGLTQRLIILDYGDHKQVRGDNTGQFANYSPEADFLRTGGRPPRYARRGCCTWSRPACRQLDRHMRSPVARMVGRSLSVSRPCRRQTRGANWSTSATRKRRLLKPSCVYPSGALKANLLKPVHALVGHGCVSRKGARRRCRECRGRGGQGSWRDSQPDPGHRMPL